MNTIIHGVALQLGDRVNTDIHCSSKYMPGKNDAFVAAHAFEKLEPGFATKASEYRQAGQAIVLVAGADFGINSSREQAAQILREMGVAVVVAPSFARAFYRNALNNGLALITAQTQTIQSGQALDVDLAAGTITPQGGTAWQGLGLSGVLLQIVSAGGLLPFLSQNKGWPTPST